MKKFFFFLLLLPAANILVQAGSFDNPSRHNENAYIRNKGQWPETVLFLLQSPGLNTWITKGGVVFDYYEVTRSYAETGKTPAGTVTGQVIRMEFNTLSGENISVSASDPLAVSYNFFKGNDPAGWATDVKAYKHVILHNVFHHIAMEFSVENGMPRYDFIVDKGGNPTDIQMAVKGALSVKAFDNHLELKTVVGTESHGDISAFQQGRPVKCRPVVTRNVLSFELSGYDPEIPLRIDPLVYSTFFGGAYDDAFMDMVLDEDENIYVAGYTWSMDFPVTEGAYQHDFSGGGDAMVSGFSSDGKSLIFSTYLGGGNNDLAVRMTYNGALIITGLTYSDNFPVTAGAFQTQSSGGGDVFIASLNTAGNQLNFSTYLGGSGIDKPLSVDEKGGQILVGGYTLSQNFPVTGDAVKDHYTGDGFLYDGFVTVINSGGSALDFSSYFGGYNEDIVNAVLFENGNDSVFYVAGRTGSSDFPVTPDAFDVDPDTGHEDAFVTKFVKNEIEYSTFLGGSSMDVCTALADNGYGNIIVAGMTRSDDFPVTPDAFSSTHRLDADGFLVKLLPDGISGTDDLIYGTYFGGAGEDDVSKILLSNGHLVYVAGTTNSFDFPTTGQAEYSSQIGNKDGFLIRFDLNTGVSDYGTYFGGSFTDDLLSLGLKSNGYPVLCGDTRSFNYPVSGDAFMGNLTNDSYLDAFLTILEIVPDGINENGTEKSCLGQNVPNPFRRITTIPFTLESSGNVRLVVTDREGRTVLSEKRENLPSGNGFFRIDASKLPSGIYFYTLITSRRNETKKMIVR